MAVKGMPGVLCKRRFTGMRNYCGVDLESWAHSKWGRLAHLTSPERKVVDGGVTAAQTRKLLKLLRASHASVTFFVTSEIYEWHPELIEEIAEAGHEIGFHTHCHRRLKAIEDLDLEFELARTFLDRWRPKGFKAPELAMLIEAYHKLAQAGFTYSSSVYGATERPIRVDGLIEIPVTTRARWNRSPRAARIPQPMSIRLWLREQPIGSAYYLGLFGWRPVHNAIAAREAAGLPSNIFIHNWQLFVCNQEAWRHQYMEALRRPAHLPYARVVANDFRELLERHSFQRLDSNPVIHSSGPLTPRAKSVEVVPGSIASR